MDITTPNVLHDEHVERMCRAVCQSKGINPDGDGFGMGRTMPEGSHYKLWEAQKSTVMSVINELNHV